MSPTETQRIKRMVAGSRHLMVRPRVYLRGIAIGPGKVDLLRLIDEKQSISAAARAMGLTYKKASLFVATLNQGLGKQAVEAVAGGRGGGGARLTPFGQELVARYAALEAKLNAAAQPELGELQALVE